MTRGDRPLPDPVVLPVLGIASCVVLATQIEAAVWLRGLAIVAVGTVLAAISAARRSKRAAEEAAPDAG
ncbi:hypothetical protein [Streptomyces tendae]|uniref:hypothetical protein n=1 Tax=Streptomyces tendae TaxID=1932 RepID=UPI003D6477E7